MELLYMMCELSHLKAITQLIRCISGDLHCCGFREGSQPIKPGRLSREFGRQLCSCSAAM
jgi:hypothetical protein